MAQPSFNIVSNSNPAERHAAITPSDSTDLNPRPRAFRVIADGNLVLVDEDGTSITYPVTVGELVQFRAKRVSAATTATVVAWY